MSLHYNDDDTKSNSDDKDKESRQNTKDKEGNGDSNLEDTVTNYNTDVTENCDLTSDDDSELKETSNKLKIQYNLDLVTVIDDYCNSNSFGEEEGTRQRKNIKADKVADQIIKVFIVKRKQRLIDQDNQNDNISYEESEVRIMLMGIALATLLASISVILIIMAFQQQDSPDRLQISYSAKVVNMKFLSPYVTFMDLSGTGRLFTLKQNMNLSFQYDWEIKLPRVPLDTGYFVFNDGKAVFVMSSNSNQKMTMIKGPKHHVTLSKSHIIDNFYTSGSIIRIGNFVMVFGGYYKYLNPDKLEFKPCTLSTAIWSIKRQRWMPGPSLPGKITDCNHFPTGFSVNRTVGVILAYGSPRCIDAYTFSLDTLQWANVKDCSIETRYNLGHQVYLTCATYFDRLARLKVLVLQSEDVITAHYVRVHKQTFLLEWFGDQSMRVKHLDHSMGLNSDVFNPPAITTFTQSSKVYLTVFHGTVVEIFEFDENATETFVLKQQMNLKSYNITSHSRISATPFWK